MITLPIDSDVSQIDHINRFVDLSTSTLYLVESVGDYADLPQSVIGMLGEQWYTLQGIEVPNGV